MIDVTTATINQLRTFDVPVGQGLSIYKVGGPLVAAGYSQDEIVYALFSLERERVIELLPSNGLRLLKPLPPISDATDNAK